MHPVTAHAVVRWLERVRHVAVPAGACEHDRAEAGCAAIGIGVDEARAAILPERVRRLLPLGPSAVVAGGYRMPVVEGRVVTVTTPDDERERRRGRQRKWRAVARGGREADPGGDGSDRLREVIPSPKINILYEIQPTRCVL